MNKKQSAGKINSLSASAKLGEVAAQINVNPLSMISSFLDHKAKVEVQVTERTRIIAERDVAIEALRGQRAIIEMYFTERFRERREVLNQLGRLLEVAVTTRDVELVDRALGGMVTILKDNPLSDFQKFKAQLESKKGIII